MNPTSFLRGALVLAACLPAFADGRYERQDALGLEVRVPHPPTWIQARDGRHAQYELHIANLRRHDLVLERVEVLDAATERTLLSLSGDALRRDVARRGWSGPDAEATLWRGGQHGIVFIGLVLADPAGPPLRLKHRIYTSLATDGTDPSGAPRRWMLETGPVPVGTTPLVLSAPVRGEGWLAGNALSNDADHRRALIPIGGRAGIAQRYAIDWVRIGPNGLLTRDAGAGNAGYFGYDEPVLAAADGRVALVRDGIPENVPFAEDTAVPVTLDTAAGNCIMLEVGGAYLLYGHLRPGSIVVRPGDPVRRGQVLARVGNSGQSDAPHLHFHVSDTPISLGGEGLAYVFEEFRDRGSVGNLYAWMESGEAWRAEPGSGERRTRALPLDGDVVDFPP